MRRSTHENPDEAGDSAPARPAIAVPRRCRRGYGSPGGVPRVGDRCQPGDYIDPNAGRILFGTVGTRWLRSRIVDPSSAIRYESVYRLHVEPTFGRRQVRSIKPSEITEWLTNLGERFDSSTARTLPAQRSRAQGMISLWLTMTSIGGTTQRLSKLVAAICVRARKRGVLRPWNPTAVAKPSEQTTISRSANGYGGSDE